MSCFLETHWVFPGNIAFKHSAMHKTTWQGLPHDVSGSIVPVYNYTIMTDARSFNGTYTSSDHRFVVQYSQIGYDQNIPYVRTCMGHSACRRGGGGEGDAATGTRYATGNFGIWIQAIRTNLRWNCRSEVVPICTQEALKTVRDALHEAAL